MAEKPANVFYRSALRAAPNVDYKKFLLKEAAKTSTERTIRPATFHSMKTSSPPPHVKAGKKKPNQPTTPTGGSGSSLGTLQLSPALTVLRLRD